MLSSVQEGEVEGISWCTLCEPHFGSHCPEEKASGQAICFPAREPSSVSPQSSELVDICPFALLTLFCLSVLKKEFIAPTQCGLQHFHTVSSKDLCKGQGGITRQWKNLTNPASAS